MKVRWTIVVEGSTLEEMREKAEHAYTEWAGNVRYKNSLIPEDIFLDAEVDVIEENMGGPNRILSYKAWASRNVEIL